MASSKIIRPSFSMFFSHVLGHGCAGCGIMFHDIGFLLYTSICARKTSNTYNYFYTCLQASQSCDALQSTDPQAYHAKRSKDSHTHTRNLKCWGRGPTIKSTFPYSRIRRDRTYVHGSASEVVIPTKLRGRDG